MSEPEMLTPERAERWQKFREQRLMVEEWLLGPIPSLENWTSTTNDQGPRGLTVFKDDLVGWDDVLPSLEHHYSRNPMRDLLITLERDIGKTMTLRAMYEKERAFPGWRKHVAPTPNSENQWQTRTLLWATMFEQVRLAVWLRYENLTLPLLLEYEARK